MDIEELRFCIDEMVKPAVEAHEGDVEFISYIDGVVTLKMLGTCNGCPMSQITLKDGIKRLLKEEFPEIIDVVGIETSPTRERVFEDGR